MSRRGSVYVGGQKGEYICVVSVPDENPVYHHYLKQVDMEKHYYSFSLFLLLIYLFSCNSCNKVSIPESGTQTTTEVKSVFINGDSLHYIDMGKGEPVVLVHGSLGDYRTWGKQMDTFSSKYRVIAYSRRYAYPNNKNVSDSADFSITPHTKDLNELLKVLNLGPVHLVGHSYGGFTALLTTMEHPELVKTLTLGEPPVMPLMMNLPGGDTIIHSFISQTLIPAAEAFKANDSVKAVSLFINGVMGDTSYFSKIGEPDRELIMTNVLETRGTSFTKNPFPPVNCDDLQKIKTPVLLVDGEISPKILLMITDELKRCIPNSERATLANTSHGLEYENPAEFNKVVLGFIDKH